MSVEVEVPPDVECRTHVVRLPIDEAILRELIEKERGALWFPDAEVNEGAQYVSSWFYAGIAMVAFHVETARPLVTRRFVLAPIHHTFMRESAVVLDPLGMIVVPMSSGNALFTLYEATTNVIRDRETSN